MFAGLEEAAKIAKPWPPGSAVLMVVTDGDTVPATGMPKMPASVGNNVVMVGVGSPTVGKAFGGHMSRQDVSTLRQVATRLNGSYHDGNEKHLTTELVSKIDEKARPKGGERVDAARVRTFVRRRRDRRAGFSPGPAHAARDWVGTGSKPTANQSDSRLSQYEITRNDAGEEVSTSRGVWYARSWLIRITGSGLDLLSPEDDSMTFRILLLTGWLLLGMAGAVAHFVGPGVERQKLDLVAQHLRAAKAHAAAGDTLRRPTSTTTRMKTLPAGRVAEARAIRIERAKAQMLARQLPEAHGDLKLLVDELSADPGADPKLLADARSALANSQYYMTWLMRLEGLGATPGSQRSRPPGRPTSCSPRTPRGAATRPPQRSIERIWSPPFGSPGWNSSDLQGLPLPVTVTGLCQRPVRPLTWEEPTAAF